MKITDIRAREILDSRGHPTLEVDVKTNKAWGRAAVPSGASTGTHEALEKRDGDPTRYLGKGVRQAVDIVNTMIKPLLIGKNSSHQQDIDNTMIHEEGSLNKSNWGANTLLGVSLAVARAAAVSLNLPLYRYLGKERTYTLPIPMMNLINGGVHANNPLDVQEFMIVPKGFKNFSEALRCGSEIFHTLKKNLAKDGYPTNVGDEGGFAPPLCHTEEACDFLVQAIGDAGYVYGQDISISLDVAATEFYKNGMYNIQGQTWTCEEMIAYYKKLNHRYAFFSIEDGLQEDDFIGWSQLTQELGKKMWIIGDDLFVTHISRLQKGIKEEAANAILVKPNQIGTLTETLETITLAQKNKYKVIISHRSGETEDTFIADLAVAVGADAIKTGSLSRSERTAKYNQLLRIEENLTSLTPYDQESWV